MKKHLLLFFIMALLPLVASAYDAYIDGIYYNLSGNEATVTYLSWESNNNSNAYSGALIIPSSVSYNGKTYNVTCIGNQAFYYCNNLISITIPNNVTSIGIRSFDHCSNLTSITIPNNVISIGDYAFSYCNSLTSITIGNGVTTIGNYIFENCNNLTFILVETGNTTYDSRNNCNAIIETATNTLIAGCPKTIIPNSVTTIGNLAFYQCNGLTSITIPKSVTRISNFAFVNCSNLASIDVEKGNANYDSRNNCNAIIEKETNILLLGCKNTVIPNSVTNIGQSAFSCCSGLTSITIPNSVTSIGQSAFYNCSGLTSVTIPSSVTSIGRSAFSGCSSLTSITIPEGVTSIGDGSFQYCSGLTSIIIPNSVTSIGNSAFSSCSGLTSITIPNSVTSIGNSVFFNCNGLTSVTIPNSVTSIGNGAFWQCSSLTSITIPESITKIPDNIFFLCTGLTSVSIPNSVRSIGRDAFYNCYNLTTIAIPSNVTTIGSYAFSQCGSLSSFTIPNSVTSIGNYAFSGCYFLTDLFVNYSSLTSSDNWGATLYDKETSEGLLIKNDMVVKCRVWATSVTIPQNVTSVGNGVFSGCNDLFSLKVEEGNTVYDSRNNCNAVIETGSNTLIAGCKNTIIPNSVTSIGNSAFSGCNGLTSIIIPNSVTSIGDGAFTGCSNLSSFSIPECVTNIGSFFIATCDKLRDVYCYAKQVPATDYNTFIETPIKNITLHVPASALDAYKTTEPWSGFGTIVAIEEEDDNIQFADANVKALCVANWDTNSDGELSKTEAAAVASLGTVFKNNADITSFNELQYFIGLTSIGNQTFSSCTQLTSIAIPGNVTSIEYQAFNNCTSLTSVIIPRNVTNLGDGVFNKCSDLTSVAILGNVTSIGWSVFGQCSSLTSITIPESVTSVGEYAFYNCSSLKEVISKIKNPFTTGLGAFSGIPSDATLYVPAGTESQYRSLSDWNRFANIVPIWRIGPNGDFATISSAMQDSRVKDGHVLQVLPGTNITGDSYITKAVTIVGNGYEDINDGYVNGIYIERDNVKLKGLYTGYIYVRANYATIERCRANNISSANNDKYEYDDATIRGCFVLGRVGGYNPDNIVYGWNISNNIIISTDYKGNAIDYLEEATLDHNLIINYDNNYYAVGDVKNKSSFTNNIILEPTNHKGISDVAVNSAIKFEYNIISNIGTYATTNITGYNNMANLFVCTGDKMTDAYYKLAAGSPALGYANDGGDCGPWSGTFPYWINGKEHGPDPDLYPDPNPTWKLDPTLTTNLENHEFATLDALVNYLLSHQLEESVTVDVADGTYTMDVVPNLSSYSYSSMEELIKILYGYIGDLEKKLESLVTYYSANNITISLEAPHEAVFKFYIQYSRAFQYIQGFMAYKAQEMLAQGISQEEVKYKLESWNDYLKDIEFQCQQAIQQLVNRIMLTNITICIDCIPPIPPFPEPNDLLSLRNIYNILGGSSWTNKKWNINNYDYTREDFPGVDFDDEGYVVQIKLENNNLRGSINPNPQNWTWLLGLPRLTGLYLQKNNISGDLSPWLCGENRGNRLKALDMSYNNLTEISDTIPSSITSLILDNQNREWYRPSGVYTDPLKIEAMADMSPIRLYLSSKQKVAIPSLFTYDRLTQTHSARPDIYIINAEGTDKYGHFTSSDQDTYSLKWSSGDYTEKQDAPCYVRFGSPFNGSVYPAYLHYIEGDANMSGYTNVLDVQTTLNYVLMGGGVWQFNRSAANTYEDNQINVQDIVCMVNIVLNNEAIAPDIITDPINSRRLLSRATNDTDVQAWLYTQQGRVMLTSSNEMGAIDLELKGVTTSQVSLLLNHSQYQMIGRNTEHGSRYIIFSPTGQPIPAAEDVSLLAVSMEPELLAAQAADMEAQEMALAIGQPTGLAQVLGGALRATFQGDDLIVTISTDVQDLSLRLYSTGGQVVLQKEESGTTRGELRLQAPVMPGAYILEMTTRQGGRKIVKLMKR